MSTSIFYSRFIVSSRPEDALKLLGKATAAPPRKVDYYDRSEPVQARLHKSLKLWTLYTDLEESLGTFETTKVSLQPELLFPPIDVQHLIFNCRRCRFFIHDPKRAIANDST